jgi:iron complex transport system substrate-binding protein
MLKVAAFSFAVLLFSLAERGGTEVPLRIVSLNPATTELIFDLGKGDQIVGTSEWSDVPAAAKKVPRVGSYVHPNFEQISRLRPELIVYSEEGEDYSSDQIEKLPAKKVVLKLRHLDDFPSAITLLAKALSAEKKGAELVSDWKKAWASIPRDQNKSILLMLEAHPLITIGGDTFLSEAFSRCGFKNVLSKEKGYPRISNEAAWALKPDLIVHIQHVASAEKISLDWPGTYDLRSVVSPELGRLTSRLPDAVKKACAELKRTRSPS